MCNCNVSIAKKMANKFRWHNKDMKGVRSLFVFMPMYASKLSARGNVEIPNATVFYQFERSNGVKGRFSNQVDFKFCPFCGEKFPKASVIGGYNHEEMNMEKMKAQNDYVESLD